MKNACLFCDFQQFSTRSHHHHHLPKTCWKFETSKYGLHYGKELARNQKISGVVQALVAVETRAHSELNREEEKKCIVVFQSCRPLSHQPTEPFLSTTASHGLRLGEIAETFARQFWKELGLPKTNSEGAVAER